MQLTHTVHFNMVDPAAYITWWDGMGHKHQITGLNQDAMDVLFPMPTTGESLEFWEFPNDGKCWCKDYGEMMV
jgi:hypothetical protein